MSEFKRLEREWPTEIGQCLSCGGRGGAPGIPVCRRCRGTGEDPDRHSDWYLSICAPEQMEAQLQRPAREEET